MVFLSSATPNIHRHNFGDIIQARGGRERRYTSRTVQKRKKRKAKPSGIDSQTQKRNLGETRGETSEKEKGSGRKCRLQ